MMILHCTCRKCGRTLKVKDGHVALIDTLMDFTIDLPLGRVEIFEIEDGYHLTIDGYSMIVGPVGGAKLKEMR
jgi:hypothetical protein